MGKEFYNKPKVFDALLDLLNDVSHKDKAWWEKCLCESLHHKDKAWLEKYLCESLQIKNISENTSSSNQTIKNNEF